MGSALLFCLVIATSALQCFGYRGSYCANVSRSDWDARPPKNQKMIGYRLPQVIIHHTETSSCSDVESCSRILRSIQNYHMGERGWDDIGYNFLIGGDGKVYVGRNYNRQGAHTTNFNSRSLGVALIGNFQNELPPRNMLTATEDLIECGKQYFLTRDYLLHGHRDAKCTDCPGQALYDEISTWDRFESGPLRGYTC